MNMERYASKVKPCLKVKFDVFANENTMIRIIGAYNKAIIIRICCWTESFYHRFLAAPPLLTLLMNTLEIITNTSIIKDITLPTPYIP